MSRFIGRKQQLGDLDRLLQRIASDTGARPGKALLVRGRRRVGKSRLVEEFLERAGVPFVFFTASTRSTEAELRLFAEEVAFSSLPDAGLFREVTLTTWDAAFRLLAQALPDSGPSVVVIDELPYLKHSDDHFDGTLQKLFDRELSRRRVLVIGIGSDLAMMESLNAYGQPFHQRATEMVVPPLSPREVGDMLGLSAADSFDAFLVTGGLPLICDEWPAGAPLWDYLGQALSSPTSALLVSAERALAAEFPPEAQARIVLGAIGAGERSFSNIGRAAGGLPQASLSRSLATLTGKRAVAVDLPVSTRPSKETRYRVADPYLRFWLTFLGPHLHEVERGRGDRVLERIERSWLSWRGRAVEPVVRESVARLPESPGWVGGYWTRTNDPEIDLVLADRGPVARQILTVGSIKWLERAPFDAHDFAALVHQRGQLPGASADTPLLVVARAGCDVPGVRTLSADQLLDAWR